MQNSYLRKPLGEQAVTIYFNQLTIRISTIKKKGSAIIDIYHYNLIIDHVFLYS